LLPRSHSTHAPSTQKAPWALPTQSCELPHSWQTGAVPASASPLTQWGVAPEHAGLLPHSQVRCTQALAFALSQPPCSHSMQRVRLVGTQLPPQQSWSSPQSVWL
jgi:hypothetical protein